MTEVVDAGLSTAIDAISDPQLRTLGRRFFRFVARADVAAYSTAALIAEVEQLRAFAQVRQAGTPLVEVRDENDAPFTVATVVTDDMPFLVDSVSGELSLEGRSVRLIIHPQLVVRRDSAGQLLEILDIDVDQDRPADAIAESWMRIDMDRDGLINGFKVRIRGANLQQLADIGTEIGRLDDDIKAALRDLYRARKAELDQVVAEA